MKHPKPYVPMCRRTPQSPERWQTARWNGERYERAPAGDMQAAVYACQACPLLAACSTEPPVPESIHAGTIYDAKNKPYTSVSAFCARNRKNPPPATCGEAIGTNAGYHIHRKNDEKACDPCQAARGAEKRKAEARKTACADGHAFSPENTRMNKRWHRICIVCRPSMAYMLPYPACGSLAAAEVHYRRGEPMCDLCIQAAAMVGLQVAS